MQVILTQDVEKLGGAGDIVTVKAGYGRNYLIPRGLAAPATTGSVAQAEHAKRIAEGIKRKNLADATAKSEQLEGSAVSIRREAGEDDKLFGSVGPIDIVEALSGVQVEAERAEIRMPEGPIQELGEFQIGVHLHPDVDAEILVRVVAAE